MGMHDPAFQRTLMRKSILPPRDVRGALSALAHSYGSNASKLIAEADSKLPTTSERKERRERLLASIENSCLGDTGFVKFCITTKPFMHWIASDEEETPKRMDDLIVEMKVDELVWAVRRVRLRTWLCGRTCA